MTLAVDPGRLSKRIQIPRFVKMKLGDKLRWFQIAAGFRRQFQVLPDGWASPDSELVQRAAALAA